MRTRPIFTRLVLTALIVIVLLVSVACQTNPTAWYGPTTGPVVTVNGDSLVVGALAQGNAEFKTAGYRYAIDARSGTRADQHLDSITTNYAPAHPWAAVFELGHNDLLQGETAAQLLADQAEAHARYGNNPCFVRITIYGGGRAEFNQAEVDAYNQAVLAVDGIDNNVTVDWNSAVLADPTLVSDGLHPSDPHGREVFASMIASGVARCLQV